ncbi:hypothetical protein BCV69DRAFT_282055 [Microstroma glucosiphilum]|uniref:F-box domain-containing protein n=1 Tax=Pseudomicrostroma glucosiphilum TaxID=1684307 RepID=A0A316U7U6_9BASI|nr:hypothetical protein BCV69DRAFT_282055 [Pseudomicrostroma glucosiphilum]PWN21319.1 hypothetical protein BCV69DRAFT_282055 [Pseudomicrostroma glucosiphilum]
MTGASAAFLPIELIPEILYHLAPPTNSSSSSTSSTTGSSSGTGATTSASPLRPLLNTALVSHDFYKHTAPLLYNRLFLRSQARVVSVFRTLASSPYLCSLVQVLELRAYPLGMGAEQLERLERDVGRALGMMRNLRVCVWTRMGSLNGRVLPDLLGGFWKGEKRGEDEEEELQETRKSQLHTLELTGNTRFYDVQALWKGKGAETSLAPKPPPSRSHSSDIALAEQVPSMVLGESDQTTPQSVDLAPRSFPFPSLLHLSFLLPDPGAIRATLELSKRRPLKSITLLCQHTNVLSPSDVEELALSVQEVEKLVLVGCKSLEGEGLRRLLKGSESGVRILGVEGCSVQPSAYPSLQPFLEDSLRTLSLTLPRSALSSHAEFYQELKSLVSSLRLLEEFTLYAPGGVQADEEPASGENEIMYAGLEGLADLPLRVANGEQNNAVANDPPESGSLHDYTPLPKYVPRLPLSLLRALLQHRRMAGNAAQLKLLRIHGIVCSTEGLGLIGQAAEGLQDLTLQLEYTPIQTLSMCLSPLAPTLARLHILSRPGSQLEWPESDLQRFASHLVNLPLAESPSDTEALPETAQCGQGDGTHEYIRPGALVQVGLRNRVWEVERRLVLSHQDAFRIGLPSRVWAPDEQKRERGEGERNESNGHADRQSRYQFEVSLKRWDASEGRWPEALLVIKA